MNDEQEVNGHDMGGRAEQTSGEAVGDADVAADDRDEQTSGRVQRAVAQAQDAADQFVDLVRARPIAAAAVALGVGYLFGRRR